MQDIKGSAVGRRIEVIHQFADFAEHVQKQADFQTVVVTDFLHPGLGVAGPLHQEAAHFSTRGIQLVLVFKGDGTIYHHVQKSNHDQQCEALEHKQGKKNISSKGPAFCLHNPAPVICSSARPPILRFGKHGQHR